MAYDQEGGHRDSGHRDGGNRGGGQRGGGRGYGRRDDRRDDRRGIPLSVLDPATTESSRKLIGAAIEVHKNLGPGYDAATYANALRVELAALSVGVELRYPISVMYQGQRVGEAVADLRIDGRFFVDVLARPGQVGTYERLALRAKLKAADIELGLIINFAERRLKDGLVRVVNVDKIQKEKGLSFDDGFGTGDGNDASEDRHDEFDDRA